MNNQKPIYVNAFGGSYITNNIYDTTLMEMEFKNKVKSHIYVSWLHPFKEQKLVVIGSKKMAVFDDMSSEKLFVYPYKVNFENVPVAEKAEHYTFNSDAIALISYITNRRRQERFPNS